MKKVIEGIKINYLDKYEKKDKKSIYLLYISDDEGQQIDVYKNLDNALKDAKSLRETFTFDRAKYSIQERVFEDA